MNIKDLVKNNIVDFFRYRAGVFYYTIVYPTTMETYVFPVPLDDIGDATMFRSDKAILFMRWIRKAIADGTLIAFDPTASGSRATSEPT